MIICCSFSILILKQRLDKKLENIKVEMELDIKSIKKDIESNENNLSSIRLDTDALIRSTKELDRQLQNLLEQVVLERQNIANFKINVDNIDNINGEVQNFHERIHKCEIDTNIRTIEPLGYATY